MFGNESVDERLSMEERNAIFVFILLQYMYLYKYYTDILLIFILMIK